MLFRYIGTEWSGLKIHSAAQEIQDELRQRDKNGKLATLAPLYAIEADIPIYPELATGPFLYRVGDLLDAEQREKFIAVSPETIAKFFDSDPPDAIFVGFEDTLDFSLEQYAQAHDYEMILGDFGGGRLYIRR